MANNPRQRSTPNYAVGYTRPVDQLMGRRSAAAHARYLLPHLRSGMRVLDVGCGPGSISLGLADAVAPGELHGINMEQSQVDLAIEAANAGRRANAHFQVGDASDLPFPENHFDAVHYHTVLLHIPDISAALAEAKHVLKSGGILASRDMMGDMTFVHPEIGRMGEIIPGMLKLIGDGGGHPFVGREQGARFRQAGFVAIESQAAFESFGSPEEVELFALVFGEEFAQNVAPSADLDQLRRDAVEWKSYPGAFAGFTMADTIGRKP